MTNGEPMSDLISREATLKHIEKIRQDAQIMDDIRRASIIMLGMDLGEEAVRNQPSAQPGIIHCINCKHHIDEKLGMVYCPEMIGGWVKDDCFCSMWEGKR